MTTKLIATIALSVSALFCGCGLVKADINVLKASKNIVKKDVKTSDFTGIATKSCVDVVYSQGPKKVQIVASDNIIQYVKVSVENNTLYVDFKHRGSVTINKGAKLEVVVSTPTISTLTTMSSGDIDVTSGINQKHGLKLNTLSSGDIEIKGNVTLSGSLDASTNSSGDISMPALKANEVSLQANSAGDIKIANIACSQLKAASNSSGDLKLAKVSAPDITMIANSAGDVIANVDCTNLMGGTNSSGDVKVSGRCKNAQLSSRSSGDVYATDLKVSGNISVSEQSSGSVHYHK